MILELQDAELKRSHFYQEVLAEDLLGFEQPSDLDRWLDRALSRGDGD